MLPVQRPFARERLVVCFDEREHGGTLDVDLRPAQTQGPGDDVRHLAINARASVHHEAGEGVLCHPSPTAPSRAGSATSGPVVIRLPSTSGSVISCAWFAWRAPISARRA